MTLSLMDSESGRRENAFSDLLTASMQSSLPGEAYDKKQVKGDIDSRSFVELLSWASYLALSEDLAERNVAFEIVSRLAELHLERNSELSRILLQLFARLGNFPAIDVVQRRSQTDAFARLGLLADLEVLARRHENAAQVGTARFEWTDFQARLYELLETRVPLSISAPTSAGKSFVFLAEIVARIAEGEASRVAYLVPTRALIRQVVQSLRKLLTDAGCQEIPVRCIPVPLDVESSPGGVIYVLTQERLVSLLHSDTGSETLSSLYVDEAQGVGPGSGARGVLLQTAIDEVRLRFPACSIRFAGPMIRNPEYLLSLFGLANEGRSVITEEPPVTQNIIRVEGSSRESRCARFFLVRDGGNDVSLGMRQLDHRVGTTSQAKARFALSLPRRAGCTVLYANTPHQAEALAANLSRVAGTSFSPDPKVAMFREFVTNHVHPQYALASCLERGVAFHHGSMPTSVREGVEELVLQEKISFICCTSTLLQGVNLPAKDIVIAKPRKGQRQPMKRIDFLNLAGRAGRLAQELHGNVWCLEPGSWEAAEGEESGCLSGERKRDVKAVLEQVLEDGGSLVSRLIDGEKLGRQEDLAAATLSKLYTDFVMPGKSLAESPLATSDNRRALELLEMQLHRTAPLHLPRSLVKRNCAIVPSRLQELHAFLASKADLASWLPVVPHGDDSYKQLERIFRVTARYLSYSQTREYLYDTWLATQWILNKPLRQIIEMELAHSEKKKARKQPSSIVRKVIDDIEERLRFRAVKNFRAYCDILNHIAEERGIQEDLGSGWRHFYLHLECGASDSTVLNLIGLGLSRTTALLLRPHMPTAAREDPEECMRVIRRLELRSLPLPWNCLQEISLILGQRLH